MIRERKRIKGMVTYTVRDSKGEVKRFEPGIMRRLLHIRGRKMQFRHHNIITAQGERLLADWITANPTKAKITPETGSMICGTGWTGNSIKQNTNVNTPTGTYNPIDSGFPDIPSQDPNVVVFQSTFTYGSLNAENINEIALLNGNNATAECLAYAQVSPALSVMQSDTLTVDWSILFYGS